MSTHHCIRFWALVAMMCLAGCSDLGEPIRLVAHAELSSTSLDFGTVAVSARATRDLTVSNTGTGVLHGAASVACSGYTIDRGGGAFALAPGGTHTVVVAYAPGAAGREACRLDLGPDIPGVDLTGEGALQAPGAQCQLSVPSLTFASTAVGSSRQAGYTISNPGSAPLILNVVAACPDFVVVSGGGPATLDPGGSLPVTVQFVPRGGGVVSCTIATGPGCPDLGVNGTATSVSFANDLVPIMRARSCLSCHDFGRTTELVNVHGLFYPDRIIVIPSDPERSLLYIKIKGPPPAGLGARMPEGLAPLTGPQIDQFRRWILEGALNN